MTVTRWWILLADYLGTGAVRRRRRRMPVLPWSAPEDLVEDWAEGFPPRHRARPQNLGRCWPGVIARSNHLHHPRLRRPPGDPARCPSAALCDLVASLLNNGIAVYEMGPVVTAMERHLVALPRRRR